MIRKLAPALLLASLLLTSCAEDEPVYPPDPGWNSSEDYLLTGLQVAIRQRSADELGELLADDYRYYPDPDVQALFGLEYWTRDQDLRAVKSLFESAEITRIVVDMKWPARSARGAGFTGARSDWTRLDVQDIYLDVDQELPGEEANTFRVEDHIHQFFFRHGRTFPPSGPGDTLIYLVEWRDLGRQFKPGQPSAVVPESWSSIKGLFFVP